GLTFSLGHGGVPSRESGDVEHHQPAMTAPLSEFAELSAHYLCSSAILIRDHRKMASYLEAGRLLLIDTV
ncbi:hypothetical protein, partial [Oryzicola mucosus]|uniref:hypothetical protein n=1 Tax=Oryzicola mucosus TaxID=2767425 RepID=UPI001AEF1807